MWDVLLHAFLLIGMNCGLRYDKLSKIGMEELECSDFGISCSITEGIKNDTDNHVYHVREWSDKELFRCILMYPTVTIEKWILLDGEKPECLFCSFTGWKKIRKREETPHSSIKSV